MKTSFSNTNPENKPLWQIRAEEYAEGFVDGVAETKTFTEEAKSAICDSFCKYVDTESQESLETICEHCPLNEEG